MSVCFPLLNKKQKKEKLAALNLLLCLGNQLNPTRTVKKIRLVDIDGAPAETAMIPSQENKGGEGGG